MGSRWKYCVGGLAAMKERWGDTYAVCHAAFHPSRHGILGLEESFQMVVPSRRQRPDVLALSKDVEDSLDHHRRIAGDGRIGADW